MVKPYYIKGVQKQPFADGLQNRCSSKFCKIHRKATVMKSFFNKVTGLKRLHRKCFSYDFCEIFNNTL